MLKKTLLILLSLSTNVGVVEASSSDAVDVIQSESGPTGSFQTGSQALHHGPGLTNEQLQEYKEAVRARLMATAANPEGQHAQQMLKNFSAIQLSTETADAQKKSPAS